MTFAHDTESALNSTAALVCTAAAPDTLTTVTELREFLSEWQYTGLRVGDDSELSAVRSLRPTLREFWTRDRDGTAELVNELLAWGKAAPHLVRHDGWDWHLHATSPTQPLAERIAVEAAMAVSEVIRADEGSRLKECAAAECAGVLVDLSRNRSRQYCGLGCGNRAHVAAYRARQAKKAT